HRGGSFVGWTVFRPHRGAGGEGIVTAVLTDEGHGGGAVHWALPGNLHVPVLLDRGGQITRSAGEPEVHGGRLALTAVGADCDQLQCSRPLGEVLDIQPVVISRSEVLAAGIDLVPG